jgi:omega-6 fatty acid desaturase (delta-12 desaturase)
LAIAGLHLQGAPGGWSEVVKTVRQCKFVEDEGDVVFYKNAYGKASCKPIYNEPISDSGVDMK